MTDLSDRQWAILQPLLPPRNRIGRPRADRQDVAAALVELGVVDEGGGVRGVRLCPPEGAVALRDVGCLGPHRQVAQYTAGPRPLGGGERGPVLLREELLPHVREPRPLQPPPQRGG